MQPSPETVPRHRRSAPSRPRDNASGRPARLLWLVGALVLALVAGAVVTHALGAQQTTDDNRTFVVPRRTTPRVIQPPRGPMVASVRRPVSTVIPPGRGGVVRAAAVLRSWDARRSRAWAEGDVTGLRELYVEGAGARDVRLLNRYTDRGLRVEGLTTQLLAVEVVSRAPGRWHLRVTDRVAGGVVVAGRDRYRLPGDRAATRSIRLVRDRGGPWRVRDVRPVRG